VPEFSSIQAGLAKTYGSVPASTQGTTITSGGSANTKGSYVELTSATTNDANWVLIHFGNISTLTNFLVDIAIGAATEQIIIPDLSVPGRNTGAGGGSFLFPIFVPAGSRLTARCQAVTVSATIEIVMTLFSGTLLSGSSQPSSIVSAYGAVASSLGTNLDGVTANTDSAWTELTAATDRDHSWLCVAARYGDTTLAAVTRWMVDIGIGSATEAEIISDLFVTADTTSDFPYTPVLWFPYYVPAGSRLTARVRSNVATDGDRDINIRLYGA
jgi:hypothetical protein